MKVGEGKDIGGDDILLQQRVTDTLITRPFTHTIKDTLRRIHRIPELRKVAYCRRHVCVNRRQPHADHICLTVVLDTEDLSKGNHTTFANQQQINTSSTGLPITLFALLPGAPVGPRS